MEKKPLPADEKTKVISQSDIRAAVKTPARPPFGGIKTKTNTPQKKRIVPGLLATGGLLAGGIALSSFQTAGVGEQGEGTVEGSVAAAPQKAVLSTSHPVSELVADDLNFEEARDLAREEIGSHGLFTYKGVIHVTATEAEMDQMSPSEKEGFMQDITWEHMITEGTVDVNGKLMNLEFPLMNKYLEVLTDEDGNAYTRDVNGEVNLLENVTKDPLTDQLIRTDAETGEVTQFNPSVILQNMDEGRIDVSVYPSDVEITNDGEILYVGGEPAESIASAGWLMDGSGDWGYDYDGDGVIDFYDNDLFDTNTDEPATNAAAEMSTEVVEENRRSDSDLLEERIQEIADEAGIDDIRKIKIKDTDDGWDIKVKGDDGDKVKTHVTREELGATGIEEEGGIDDFTKIKIRETEDGWDVKAKTEDGEKVSMHIDDGSQFETESSQEELLASDDNITTDNTEDLPADDYYHDH